MLGWQLETIDYLSIVNIACKYIYVGLAYLTLNTASGVLLW